MNEAIDYITTAMVAWDEIWQGYPDHWIKVYGNLLSASEACDDEILEERLLDEAGKFLEQFKNKKRYRPPFEDMACLMLNLDAEKTVVPSGQALDSQLCYDCAMKHLTEAHESFKEVKQNPRAWIFIIGNMSHAANHLVERHPKLANEIRSFRKKFMDNMLVGKTIQLDLQQLCERVRKCAEQDLYDLPIDEG